MNNHIEKTLVILKPDALQRGLVGEVISRFEKIGLKIVAAKLVSPDSEFYHDHYEKIGKMISRHGQKIFDDTVKFMMTSPVLAMVLEGVEAAGVTRKLVGATEPKSALPGTIRGDYAHTSYGHTDANNKGIPNLVHASADSEEAKDEIKLWFNEDEICEYKVLHESHTR